MKIKPFNHNYFLGYINEITPQYIKIHFPSSILLSKFHFEGVNYTGGNVGNFVVIEGEEYGFLARITKLNLPDSERKEISEKAIEHSESNFHPSGEAELLLSFSVFEPDKIQKTVSKYPCIGAKVFSCSDEQIGKYVQEFGKKETESDNVYATLGKLTANDVECEISLNSLFGRHCAVVGTTGGGKSWTVSKLIEALIEETVNKIILIDATGEYKDICPSENSIEIGNGANVFPYFELTIDELYFLLKPSSKVQVPKLMEAIRSLKIVKLLNGNKLSISKDGQQIEIPIHNGVIQKAKQAKRPYEEYYYRNYIQIEDKKCKFEFTNLAKQITQECIWDSEKNDVNKWGDRNETDLSNCISLISRIGNLMNSPEYNNVFNFNNQSDKRLITSLIDDFIANGQGVLRLDFSKVDYDFQVREVLVNAIGKKLLIEARQGKFRENPIVVFIDEAHQFLNKSIKDEYFDAKPLDSFELISKEARKYGLFLCLATQMPRDIPIGTLSQMGTFIVHRLINDKDKQSIENAASSANKSALSFLPILGEGEALLVGVDFPMPLLLKIGEPSKKPISNTPRLKKNKIVETNE
jgi:energy-coupling factor transporter ATP-binding protein EcfA2